MPECQYARMDERRYHDILGYFCASATFAAVGEAGPVEEEKGSCVFDV